MLPDIRDDIFCPFFCPLILLTPQKSKFCKNEKKRLEILSFCLCVPKTTIIWGTTPEMQSETHDFLSFWTIFLSCYPPNKLKNQNFEKMKKISGDFIILHMCTKNYDHMMYASWDMECNRHNFFPGDHHFTLVYHKWKSYDVQFQGYGVWQTEFYLILDYFLPF